MHKIFKPNLESLNINCSNYSYTLHIWNHIFHPKSSQCARYISNSITIFPETSRRTIIKWLWELEKKIHPHKLQWFMLSLPLWPPVLLGLFSTQQKQLSRDDLEKSLQIQDHWLHNLHLLFEMTLLLLLLAGIYSKYI